jgi:hypothetical protein
MQTKTPEDRLLELIDNPAMKKRARREAVSNLFDFKAFFSAIASLKASVFSLWSLRLMNRVVAAAILFAAAIVCAGGQSTARSFTQRFDKAFDLTRKADDAAADRFEAFAPSAEREHLRSFSAGTTVTAERTPQQERLMRILLVGVISGDEGRQAVLEDTQAGTTVTVRPGDRYGEYTVAAVGDAYVTVNDGAKTWEIK